MKNYINNHFNQIFCDFIKKNKQICLFCFFIFNSIYFHINLFLIFFYFKFNFHRNLQINFFPNNFRKKDLKN